MIRMAIAMSLILAISNPIDAAERPNRPNIVVILADDIGYGDLGCYGAAKVKTPNLDKLASQGMRFTDAHSPASVCTPTRYALLTGQYAFRHRPGSGILSGVAPLSIPPDRATLPQMLRAAKYKTGAVGKWHLGLGENETDYNVPITRGANEVGFDYSYLIPATGDRVPCVYLENGRVVNYDAKDRIEVSYTKKIGDEPTGKENPDKLFNQKPSHGHDATIVNGISRIGWMTGGHAARWKDEEIADVITSKAATFIENSQGKPFFLYFAAHDVHVPRVPHPRFRGTSDHGLRGDCIQEFDWSVGEILKALDERKLSDNTLVIVTSDNGGVMDDGYIDGTQNDTSGHKCNGALRGFKGGLFEGGHRVPFLARWPNQIPVGKVSNELICHADLFTTCSQILGEKLGEEAAPDSIDISPALWAVSPEKPCRTSMVQQGGNPNALAVRDGHWKYIPAANAKGTPRNPSTGGAQLYDLSSDLAETKNLAAEKPEKTKSMAELLEKLKLAKRTR